MNLSTGMSQFFERLKQMTGKEKENKLNNILLVYCNKQVGRVKKNTPSKHTG